MPPSVNPRQSIVLVLSDEEATALVNLGAALEPFLEPGSPADTATAKMDEQLAQQGREFSGLVSAAEDELAEQLFDVPEACLPDMKKAAEALVRCVLGVYADAL